MAKIPFDIKYRPQIESGEYRVETTKGQPVRIICWDRSTTYWKIIGLVLAPDGKTENPFTYDVNGKESDGCLHDHEFDLFLVTPESELNEFETTVSAIFTNSQLIKRDKDGIANIYEIDEAVKRYSKRLLELARNQLQIEGLVTMAHLNKACEAEYQSGLADGKAEALKDLQENLANNDIYSVPEWMREVLLMAKENGKKEALKDMPGIEHILQERIRQIKVEGFDWRHDDTHDTHQLSDAAIVYAAPAPLRYQVMNWWPWDKDWLKEDKTFTTEGRIKELSKAGALIAAEIDRLQRKLGKLPGFKED